MAKVSFEDIKFKAHKEGVKAVFLKNYSFIIPFDTISSIGSYCIENHGMVFEAENARQKVLEALGRGFKELQNKLTGKKTTYIHKNSRIPLIGSLSFGIVDRNTTLIELKPVTGCNLNCIYCSVNEEAKTHDFVVEAEYLSEELQKLIEYKSTKGIEAHINCHGEPLLYEPLPELVKKISQIKEVSQISIDTNATLLTCDKANLLLEAGLTRFNISINSLNQGIADRIAGKPYPLKCVTEICRYLAGKQKLLLAPVLIPGINEEEIEKLVAFAKEIKVPIGIQNYLNYRQGKNPVKQYPMKRFTGILQRLEKKYDIKLILSEHDFNIRKTKPLEKPFRKGETVEAEVVAPGRTDKESIAASKNRGITIDAKAKGKIRVKLTRDKHNIFYGQLIK